MDKNFDYKEKYLKYKNKYLNLKGGSLCDKIKDVKELKNLEYANFNLEFKKLTDLEENIVKFNEDTSMLNCNEKLFYINEFKKYSIKYESTDIDECYLKGIIIDSEISEQLSDVKKYTLIHNLRNYHLIKGSLFINDKETLILYDVSNKINKDISNVVNLKIDFREKNITNENIILEETKALVETEAAVAPDPEAEVDTEYLEQATDIEEIDTGQGAEEIIAYKNPDNIKFDKNFINDLIDEINSVFSKDYSKLE